MQIYIQKLKLKSAQISKSAVITCNKLIGYTAIGRLSVLFLWTCSIVHQFSRTCCAVVRSQVFNLLSQHWLQSEKSCFLKILSNLRFLAR